MGIGGRSFRGDPGPVEREWTVRSRSDGTFTLEDPRSPLAAFHGQTVRMGPCALVEHGAVRVLLTSRPTAPWDLGQWRSQGVEPERARVIGVKSAAAHRLAYAPIAVAWLSVATPGPCPSRLDALRR
jgi:microcystin degradation protein MlrC